MYTQCPECQIAFRVTAKVLQQAAGNVRCGSCGHAFSALDYLSEDMPEHAATAAESASDAAEAHDELAETSKRLLQTLDELAGPDDVRIEDTGVEWRVLDESAAEDVSLSPDEIPGEDEIRYDDNTPLPDDFGEGDESASSAQSRPPQRRAGDYTAAADEFEERQGDLALSEPEEWTDILAEVRDPSAESLEVEEELAAIHTELSAIDDALNDEVPLLGDSDSDADAEDEAEQVEQADSDEDDDEDEDDGGDADSDHHALHASDEAVDDDDEDSGAYEASHVEIEAEDDEYESADALDEPPSGESDRDSDLQEQLDELELAMAEEADSDSDDDDASDDVAALVADDSDDDDVEWAAEADDDDDDVYDLQESAASEEEAFAEDDADETEVAALAADGDDDDDDSASPLAGVDVPEAFFDENSGEVETIIMEGEFVRNVIEQERLAAESDARNQLHDSSSLLDTYALQRGKVRGGRRSYDPPSSVVIGAIVALGVLLIGQLVHNFRQPLATYGFFNATIAPVYRMLGSPVVPDWDLKGWQFEATNGSVNEDETTLTIVSRIANQSTQSLPYPLVHIELTDRFDDVTGSAILEPAAYLAEDADPSEPVEPGDEFTAVITVDDPAADVSGYRLKVCYRIETAAVRCAEEAFRN